MRKTNIFCLILFLGTCCFSEPLVLPEDVDEIVIEIVFRHHVSHVEPKILILDGKKNKQFIRELNSSALWTDEEGVWLYGKLLLTTCAMVHKIKIYNKKKLIAEFYTTGTEHYDVKSGLFYETEKNLLRGEFWGKHKYWPYLLPENFCDTI